MLFIQSYTMLNLARQQIRHVFLFFKEDYEDILYRLNDLTKPNVKKNQKDYHILQGGVPIEKEQCTEVCGCQTNRLQQNEFTSSRLVSNSPEMASQSIG